MKPSYSFRVREEAGRPALDPTYVNDDLTFQVLDCVQLKGSPDPQVSTLDYPEVPIVRLYGVTKRGHSVLVNIYNFEPYLYMPAPPNWYPHEGAELASVINQQLTKTDEAVVRIETEYKMGLLHYSDGQPKQFLKVVCKLPQQVPKVRSLLLQGLMWNSEWRQFSTYESNVIFPLRFLVDTGIGGCTWVTVAKGKFRPTGVQSSQCQIEIDCSYNSLTNHEPVGEMMTIAPFRIMSLDIECQGRKGFFPDANHDPVIQIANHVVLYGNSDVFSKVIFTLKTCQGIAGAEVYSFDTEEDMLVAWSQYMRKVDPDILTGYNISGFDFPYLINRASTLNITNRFAYWSRQKHERTQARVKQFMSKQMGNREYVEVTVEGRVVMDVMVVIQRDYKLRSYSLNSVSQHFLGEQKEDVHHSIIADLQNGDDETRRRLAVYCLKDAYLPIRLIEKLMVIVNNVEMARVTGVPIGWLLERGQQIKVFSQILRKGRVKGLLFPTVEYSGGGDNAIGYEGATVISPMKGFYHKHPVATLDFASLYPSIMMAHNLCYSTLVRKADVKKFSPDDVTVSPSGDTYVKPHLFSGILPEILNDLLSARKRAKAMMKDAKDPLEYAVLNGRQLALKISANSVYGFTGAQVGKLPCLEISASVTSFGRQMIESTKSLAESTYPGVRVVYGDTDSVMIECCQVDTTMGDKAMLDESMAFGLEAAAKITEAFKKPIKLEFEKVYFPFLLMNKKRYAGLLWTNSEKYDKLDTKGIETVRRDNCPLVASVISGVLNRILIQRSLSTAVDFVKGTISDLLMNRLDISHLVITKAFSKAASEYENKTAHIALVERMRQRDPASAPTVGDRVAYVIIKAAKGAKAFERSEDPIYVLDHNIAIDSQYYLEHFLAPPLLRVFEGVLDNPQSLINGDHTRQIAIPAPSANAGGLMKFVKVQLQCLSCRKGISSGAVCDGCRDKEGEVYMKVLAKRNHCEATYSKVWTQCQQCQGSLHQEVICSSKDCPVFYMRKKVQKDLNEQQAVLDRFGVMDDW